jgi:FkbM family methyltransferase
MNIICILNVYKRFKNFEEQLNAVLKQSIPPKKIIIWNNNPEINLSSFATENIIVINSSQNMGVWPRFFSLYYLLSGEFVCVIDDDTIPGNNWFKNCINTISSHNALLGTRGVIFNKGNTYDYTQEFGWHYVCNHAKIVDIVGHSWFFRKEWITAIIKELPNIDDINYFICGEDTHLSYTLQKYLNIPTIVPPHPHNDTSLWGSIYEKAIKYGGEDVAISRIDNIETRFTIMLNNYINKGFETINNKAVILKTYSTCLDYFINRIKNKQNFSIMKCADGEYFVSKNQTLTNCDNWTFKTNSILNKHFNDSLNLIKTNVFYAISGPSDSEDICNYWYKNIPNTHNITFANVFVNTNFEKWKTFLKNEDCNCVLISQVCPGSRKIGGINIIDYLPIDKYLVNSWDTEYEKYFNLVSNLAKKYTNMLFFISAGPIANFFVHRMYLENPNNTYIDCGSSIDIFTKSIVTRPYQSDNTLYNFPIKNLPVVYNDLFVKNLPNIIKQIHSNHLGYYIVPQYVKGGICVDIGGNTGQFSLKYADFFKVIHIYEPQEECYEIIKENIKKYQNIFLFNEAVFVKSNEEMELISHPNRDSGSVCLNNDKIQIKEWTTNIVNKCKTISLEDIIIRVGGNIDYMKIDCETSEYNLLYDKDLSCIKHMGIELSWQLGKENFNNLVNHILKYFNNPFNCDLNYKVGSNIEASFVSKYYT